MDDSLDNVVDSGSPFEPSVTVPDPPSVSESAPVDPVPVPSPDPEPAPVDPSPEPSPDPEPVEPLPSDPVGPSPSDPDEGVVHPGEDSSVGGEQLPGGDENQQPGQDQPGVVDQIGRAHV